MSGAPRVGIGRRILGVVSAAFWVLVAATPVRAHGGVTGPQDVVQDYGVLLFLLATVLIGAGVLAWAAFSPSRDEEVNEEALAAGGTPAANAGGATAASTADARAASAVKHG